MLRKVVFPYPREALKMSGIECDLLGASQKSLRQKNVASPVWTSSGRSASRTDKLIAYKIKSNRTFWKERKT
jgi:hypothetical protein